MANKYYTLLQRYDSNNLWGIEFGSHDRSEVEEERQVMIENLEVSSNRLRIVATIDSAQWRVDIICDQINSALLPTEDYSAESDRNRMLAEIEELRQMDENGVPYFEDAYYDSK